MLEEDKNNPLERAEQALISQLSGIVALLFPHRKEKELLKGVKKIVKKARSVKKCLLEENALHYCTWESGDKDFDPLRMQPSGEHNDGKVAFLHLPWLGEGGPTIDNKERQRCSEGECSFSS